MLQMLNINKFQINYKNLIFVIILIFIIDVQHIEAHKPFFPPESNSKEQALYINQPNISQVFYFTLSEQKKEFWFELSLVKGHNLILDLGAPKFEDYKSKYPNLYLYYQNEKDFIEILSYTSDNKWGLSEFHEPFTNTYSWVYVKDRFSIEKEGTYFVRVTSEYVTDFKLWFATGIIEDFGISDLANFAGTRNKVRDFHSDTNDSDDINISLTDMPASLENTNDFIGIIKTNKLVIYVLILIIFIIVLFLYINRKLKQRLR
tara:strand:+ start:14509 stop:15291 length:783 start_codon:yes stop_codon:yes gene_type:complete